MRTALRLSISLNVALLVLLGLLAVGTRGPKPLPASIPQTVADPVAAAPSGPPLGSNLAEPSGSAVGTDSPAGPPATASTETADGSGTPPGSLIPAAPLVFEDIDLAGLNLDAGQRQAVEDLRRKFVEDVGGPNQDPADPTYLARWQQHQPENDNLLRGMIGVRAWQDYQAAARNRQ